jgi:hypothetical protein
MLGGERAVETANLPVLTELLSAKMSGTQWQMARTIPPTAVSNPFARSIFSTKPLPKHTLE